MKCIKALVVLLTFLTVWGVLETQFALTQTPTQIPAQTNAIIRTAAQIQWAKDFSFHGVAVGSTWSDLKSKFPELVPTVAGTNGVSVWRVTQEYGLTDAVFAVFGVMDGTVHSISVRYGKDNLAAIGGWTSIQRRFQDNLGPPESSSMMLCRWSIAPVDLKFSLFYLQNLDTLDLSVSNPTRSTTAHQRLLPHFEDAEAWNINIEKTVQLSNVVSEVSFSPDYQQLFYVSAQQLGRDTAGAYFFDVSLVILSLENLEVTKRISIMSGTHDVPSGGSVVSSPDAKKFAWGPLFLHGTNMFFVDSNSSKVTGVEFNQIVGGIRLCWPSPTFIDVLCFLSASPKPSYRIDLDTLEVGTLSTETSEAERASFRQQNHKLVTLTRDALTLNNTAPDLRVSSRQHAYTRLLLSDMPSEWGDTLPVIWSPDLRNIIIRKGRDSTTSLIRLGVRPSPVLDFEIKGLGQVITHEQLQSIETAFSAGKRIWLRVYDKKINPLTDRIIGPDENKYKGQGYLSQIEPSFRFRYSYESLRAECGDIVSGLQVGNGESWGLGIWGELVPVSEATGAGVPDKESTSQVTREPETANQPENSVKEAAPVPKIDNEPVGRSGQLQSDRAATLDANQVFSQYSKTKRGSAQIKELAETFNKELQMLIKQGKGTLELDDYRRTHKKTLEDAQSSLRKEVVHDMQDTVARFSQNEGLTVVYDASGNYTPFFWSQQFGVGTLTVPPKPASPSGSDITDKIIGILNTGN